MSLCTSYFNSQLCSRLLITCGRLLKKMLKPLCTLTSTIVHVGCLLWTAFMSDTPVYVHYAGNVSEFWMAWLSCFHFIYIRYYLLDTSQTLQKCLAHKTIVEYPTLHVVLSEKASSYQHVGSSQTQQGIETVVFVWEIRLNIYIQWQVTIHKCDGLFLHFVDPFTAMFLCSKQKHCKNMKSVQ